MDVQRWNGAFQDRLSQHLLFLLTQLCVVLHELAVPYTSPTPMHMTVPAPRYSSREPCLRDRHSQEENSQGRPWGWVWEKCV